MSRSDRWSRARRAVQLAGVVLVLASAACSRATSGDPADTQVDETITVRIVNHSQLDAAIYIVHDGARDRLGTVTAATSNTFPFRIRTLSSGEFTLLADPVGALRATSSEQLRVAQGSLFTWTLETDFSRGAVIVQD